MLVSDLGLPAKAYDALKACGAKTVQDVLNLPKARVSMMPKMGPVTIKKIEFALRRLGYEWIDKVADEPPVTLRDKFAMAALEGMLTFSYYEEEIENYAEQAYRLADAMMAERRR
jgi:hypothetical protein